MLSYIQKELVNVWKENVLEDSKSGNLEYKTTKKFLTDLKREFREGDKKAIKVAKLKRIEQGNKIIKEFVQKFKRAARGSSYERRPLIEEFK